MKKAFYVLNVVIVLLAFAGLAKISFAQDGNYISNPDTFQDDTSNWCDADNIWGDGRCETDTEDETEWMYNAGWYWQRVTEQDISPCDVPVQYGGFCDYGTGSITLNTPAGPVTITIALQGSSFTGADYTVAGDNFDYNSDAAGIGIDTSGNYIVIIHGNGNTNIIVGSDGDDIIYGYEGNDIISGGDGDDVIYGGDESCSGRRCNEGETLGDTINGGDGDDTVYGGNESCTGRECNTDGTVGDTINGDDGNDVIYGGDESCTGNQCNLSYAGDESNMGDTVNGGEGADDITGGDETCTGTRCNDELAGSSSANLGDTINQNDPANTDDGAVDTVDGGTEDAQAGSGNEGDTCNTSAADGDTESGC